MCMWNIKAALLKCGLSPRAADVRCAEHKLHVTLTDEREIAVPLAWFPRLERASTTERGQWRLIGDGSGIRWDAIDEDISVPGLFGLPD